MNGAPCAFFDGLVDYFTAHGKEYNAIDGVKWNGPCAEDITGKYYINVDGSMREYRYLLNKLGDYHIVLYSGDWDDVVPYTDTQKNLENLYLKESAVRYRPSYAARPSSRKTNTQAGFKSTTELFSRSSKAPPTRSRRASAQRHYNFSGRQSLLRMLSSSRGQALRDLCISITYSLHNALICTTISPPTTASSTAPWRQPSAIRHCRSSAP